MRNGQWRRKGRVLLEVFLGMALLLAWGCGGAHTSRDDGLEAMEEAHLPIATQDGWQLLDAREAESVARRLSPQANGFSSWRAMEDAVKGSLKYASKFSPGTVAIDSPTLTLTWGEIRASLERLLLLLPLLDEHPILLVREFSWYRLGPDPGFTGYYEPTLRASKVRTPEFTHPLYRLPRDVKKGRPYYDRRAIDLNGALKGRGLELAWIEDPVDAFFLQVQGSGRLAFTDGTSSHILYAGKNNRAYVSLGRVMKEEGLLEPDNVSMRSIRQYLAAHPDKRDELLCRNPSYVFFRLSDTGPYGAMQQVLTPLGSVAVDRRVIALGSILVYGVPYPGSEEPEGPVVQGGNGMLYGIAVAQDTGGAIKGKRLDLFAGAGPEAEYLAGHLDTPGAVFLLRKK